MNKKDILTLRGEAHHLKPVVIIGQHGLTEPVHEEIDLALSCHGLIKIKAPGDKAYRLELIDVLTEKHQATLINHIGGVVTLYRKKEEKTVKEGVLNQRKRSPNAGKKSTGKTYGTKKPALRTAADRAEARRRKSRK